MPSDARTIVQAMACIGPACIHNDQGVGAPLVRDVANDCASVIAGELAWPADASDALAGRRQVMSQSLFCHLMSMVMMLTGA